MKIGTLEGDRFFLKSSDIDFKNINLMPDTIFCPMKWVKTSFKRPEKSGFYYGLIIFDDYVQIEQIEYVKEMDSFLLNYEPCSPIYWMINLLPDDTGDELYTILKYFHKDLSNKKEER